MVSGIIGAIAAMISCAESERFVTSRGEPLPSVTRTGAPLSKRTPRLPPREATRFSRVSMYETGASVAMNDQSAISVSSTM